MKGRMYRPFGSCEDIQREPIQRSKPWLHVDIPRVYMWESSIPDKWFHIKGRENFHHVSETGNNRNTQDFLMSNQKYISSIADPRTKSPSALTSRVVSRVQSPQNSSRGFFHAGKGSKMTLSCGSESLLFPNETASLQITLPEVKPDMLKTKVQFAIPSKKKRLPTAKSMKSFAFSVPKKQESVLANRLSMPKRLVMTKKLKISTKGKFRNPIVDEFLKRFEKKKDSFLSIVHRKGLNGWKLVDLKKTLS